MRYCGQGFLRVPLCISIGALCFVLVGCAGLERGAGEVNLIVNPDFEATQQGGRPLGWENWQKLDGAVFRTVVDPGFAHSGSNCVAIEYTNADQRNLAVWIQSIPARAHTTYRLSFWIRTKDARPQVSYTMDHPQACAYVDFLDVNRQSLPANGHYYESSSVFMTHDWTRRELSFRTPEGTSYVKVNLAFASVVGTVYFDSVSLVASPFQKVASPDWLKDAVVYELAPWVFSQFGNGRAFLGILSKLPALQDLGVTVLYLLPVWEDQGWYAITDHYAVFRKYGSEQELKDLVAEAHQRRMKVILDLAGTIGVPKKSRLVREHPEWFILNPSNTLYVSWMAELYGLDTNRADVQEYFVQFAQYCIEQFDVDGYRCDYVAASPREMFQNARAAIQRLKPDAILIAEDAQPFDMEKAFDVTYDFQFIDTIAALLADPHSAGRAVRRLAEESDLYPPGSLRLRYLEGHDLSYTVASRLGLKGSIAFATFLFTIEGIPMIYSGQEVGNKIPQIGFWVPAMDWNGNPDAAAYRAAYTALSHIRAGSPALRTGSFTPVNCSDDRVAAYLRAWEGDQTILTVINFSAAKLDVHLDLAGRRSFQDLLTGERVNVENPERFTVDLQPFQSHVFLVARGG
jgi:glycosidase